MGILLSPGWWQVLEWGRSSCTSSLDFSPLGAYQPPSKAFMMAGLQRLPGALEDSPSMASDVASKQTRYEIQPSPSPWAEEHLCRGMCFPSQHPVLVLAFSFMLCFLLVTRCRWQARLWPQPLRPAYSTFAMLDHVWGKRQKPSPHPSICSTA